MKLPWNQKESVRHIFDSYCKKILRQENADIQSSMSFCALFLRKILILPFVHGTAISRVNTLSSVI